MRVEKLFTVVVLAVVLGGCGAPKPPGWPAGEERPINAQQQGRAVR